MLEPLLYVGSGVAVGTLAGITGIGGGSLMTPILLFGFGQPPVVAVGTDLAVAATTRLVASAPVGPLVDWQVVRRLALGSLPAATLTLVGLHLAAAHAADVDRGVIRSLALVLIATSAGLLVQEPLQRLGLRLTAAALPRGEQARPFVTLGIGALLGAAVALTSVGAGALATTALVALYPLRLHGDRLAATALAHALPLTAVAAIGHASLGHLDVGALGLLLLGAVPGALLALHTGPRLPPAVYRPLLAAVLLACAVRLLTT